MDNKTKRKLEKKKEHEKEARKKVLARRDALRAPKILENKLNKKFKRVSKLRKAMTGVAEYSDELLMNMNDATLTQLEKNAKILQALENEYEENLEKRRKINLDLESKGLFELNDKLSYLHNQLANDQQSAGFESLPEAQYVQKPRKEVAEVTISKAPGHEEISTT
jgi:hypothetical protein